MRYVSENIRRHLNILADRANSETARRDSVHVLLNTMGEVEDLETRLQIAGELIGQVDISLRALLVEHLETIRDEAKEQGMEDLEKQAERLLSDLESAEQ
jgi:hypothetical protein